MQRFMIKSKFFLFLAVSFFISAPLYANDANQALVNNTVAAFMQNNQTPGVAVLLVVAGKPKAYYYGVADRKKKTAINDKTIFEVGSLSKLMTTLLLAERINYAKMALNDPVTKYLPQLPAGFSKITLENLATHTSGLPTNVPASVRSEADLAAYFEKIAPRIKPNEEWIYSNVGIGLLGKAIEAETKKPLDTMYHDYISEVINTLSMTTRVAKRYQVNVAEGYDKYNQIVSPMPNGFFPAAYAVKISAIDAQHFLTAAIGLPGTPSSVLYPIKMTQQAFIHLAHRYQGLGWNLHALSDISTLLKVHPMEIGPDAIVDIYDRPLFNGKMLIDKTGLTRGFTSYIAVLPDHQSGIVVLTNKAVDTGLVEQLGRSILLNATGLNGMPVNNKE